MLTFNSAVDLLLRSFWPLFKAGLIVTVPLTLLSFALGLVGAFIVALMRLSKFKPLSFFAAIFVWLIRGTPLIVQLFVIFYGLPKAGIIFTPFVSAVIGLTMSQSAYNSEVIRSALISISKGQWEATKALGMTKFLTMRYVIIPQAALVAVPPLGNSFISLLKDTSLVATLTVAEIFQTGQQITAITYEPLLLYLEVAFVYLIFSTGLTYLQEFTEKKLGKHLVEQRS
ncbi:MAG: amino acid ABC transporter permease [Anaerovorax sp.]|nr:amino acid ABC transporter permease [Anaerovorax sp.]